MKTILLGDTHGRSLWKLATFQENLTKDDRVIFIGDYFDSHDKELTAAIQIHNFQEIIDYKKLCEKNDGPEVILLIGNHDHHYFPEVGYTGTSGYQHGMSAFISQTIEDNRNHLQMAYQFDEYLCTHAGVSEVFMDAAFGKYGWNITNIANDLNELFKHKPNAFLFNPLDWSGCGEDVAQSPIWIRPLSLMKAGKMDMELKKCVIQIVGHTHQNQIDILGKATGGRYYFIDTLETSGEYLVIENGVVRTANTR
jgi:predicted phosphodiesterase